MSSPFDTLSEESRERLRERDQPDWTSPMLATLTDDHFSDPDWLYERKLDGVRLLAFRNGDEVRLMTRNRKERNDAYPEIVEALEAQAARDCIVDGEVVAFEDDVTSFERLQGRMKIQDPEEACEKGWEGVIAKRAESEYVHSRSRDWLKFKCVNRQEFVVGGWTEPHGSRIGFGALLIGYHEEDALRYAGKVGTGYDEETLGELSDRLASIERKTAPFAETGGLPRKEVHWATPELVAEVEFTEWTNKGRLRHPRFVGLRDDKEPEDVVRERPRGGPA